MTRLGKIKWVASILLVFFIVLITNLIDKDNFNQLRTSVTTIYEDRIVASDLLFELLLRIQEKEVALAATDALLPAERNEQIDNEIAELIERYEQTKLTRKERFLFDDLTTELARLNTLEQDRRQSESGESLPLQESLDQIVEHLHDLSKVQLQEGRNQVLISNQAMDTVDLFTQAEIIFLVLMAVLIQIIIMYKPKTD